MLIEGRLCGREGEASEWRPRGRRPLARGGRRRWAVLAILAMLVAAPAVTTVSPAGGTEVVGVNVPTCVPLPDLGVTCPANVALNAVVYAGGYPSCTLGSGPANAVDGAASNIYTDKWCVPTGKPTLYLDLVNNGLMGYSVSKVVVKHAGVAENPILNTRAFQISMYNGIGTRTFANVTNNTASTTVHTPILNVPPYNNIRQVRLDISVPTQSTNQATRIFEVEVWATPSTTLPS